MLTQSTGNRIIDSTLEVGSYKAEIGVNASQAELVKLANKYCVHQQDLADFRNTDNAAPQTIPCRTTEYQTTHSFKEQTPSFDRQELSESSKKRFAAAVKRYTNRGLSPAIMQTWTEWRIRKAATQYQSRKIWEASIPKPSDQLKEFATFQNALHRVLRGLESDILGPRLAKNRSTGSETQTAAEQSPVREDCAPPDAFYDAHIAVSKHVIQHLLRESVKVERRLRATRAAAGAPRQPERQALMKEIVLRLGTFGKVPTQTREKDAEEICFAFGVQSRFNALDERLGSGSTTKAQSASKRRPPSTSKRPTTGK